MFHYRADIFFIYTHREEKLRNFMEDINSFSREFNFTYKFDKENVSFFILKLFHLMKN